MKTYTLNALGVQEWQTDVYASPEPVQAQERNAIHHNFSLWLTQRFGATSSQLAFVESLPPDFLELLRDELALSLRAKIEIKFEKGERLSRQHKTQDDMGDSEKIIRIRKWLEEQETGEEPEEPELPEVPKQPEKHESPDNPANPAKVEDSMHSPHKVCTHCNSENKHLKSYLLIETHYVDK